MAAGDRADRMHLLEGSCVTDLVQVGDQGVLRGKAGNRADRGKACFRVDAPVDLQPVRQFAGQMAER